MAIKLQNQSFISSSSSNPYLSCKPIRTHFFRKEAADLNHLLCVSGNPSQNCRVRHALSGYNRYNRRLVELRKYCPTFCKARRMGHLFPLASADDGVTVNGTPQASTSCDVEEMRVKLNQSLQTEEYNNGLVQSLHDAARVFELAIKEQSAISKTSWFSTAWLGVDKNAWVKALSYQAAVYSLLQAASEIASRGDGRDRDINVFVQRSRLMSSFDSPVHVYCFGELCLLRQSASLESVMRDEMSAKQPEAYEWFWSEQLPIAVTTFVNYFERDPQFTAATTVCGKGVSLGSGRACDISLLLLALTCIAAIMKLGPAKVSCSQFFSVVADITGRLMDMLVDVVPIRQVYHSMKDIGLRREFLVHFGPRAAACRVKNDQGTEEVAFWVDLVQQQLQQAIDRERIWSRLTTCESIEVLEKDLAIFGFFIALGRSTQSFLCANGFGVIDDPIESFVRYLIGGSVLYYPQLSSISSYQLYVEVVCEELDWLPFYPANVGTMKHSHDHKSERGPPNSEAIPQVLDVCSYWMQSLIKYSKWLENPSNIKAARFLSRGHNKLRECMEELGVLKDEMKERNAHYFDETNGSGIYSPRGAELDSFDKPLSSATEESSGVWIYPHHLSSSHLLLLVQALDSVEEALKRLEELLQELHASSSNSGKEHLKAACSDLERIRKLKKEAEFLEASFRAKADSLQQGDDDGLSQSSISKQRLYSKIKYRKNSKVMLDRSNRDGIPADRVVSNSHGLWSFLVPHPSRKIDPGSSTLDQTENEPFEQATTANMSDTNSESDEILRFELLRHELIELEKRVQRSADQSDNEEDIKITDDSTRYSGRAGGGGLVDLPDKENFIGKSMDKLKEASTDVWQGTQLLAIDVAAAMDLLRRATIIGDELTEKEKKALRRTLTDLASVVPIGILMLLPVGFSDGSPVGFHQFFCLLSFRQFFCLRWASLMGICRSFVVEISDWEVELCENCRMWQESMEVRYCQSWIEVAGEPPGKVTAVGHAAMLAAIQRYVPALIPSTYGPERLDLLRQLEKVKEMETSEQMGIEMLVPFVWHSKEAPMAAVLREGTGVPGSR
ncbi:hypothetical protein HHK36_016868 [Tetracentron sinense]|uniref:LETM1-like protein n=2 Tax=Magnoliopsida TaxID=3398 RepID=A0A834Z6L8_TETSI|nr:hypothetical protein HHK36_016868 [Tetracentron sinense]